MSDYSRVEDVVLTNLIASEDYARQVLHHIKPDYFQDITDKNYFILIKKFFDKFNNLPSKEALDVEIDNLKVSDEDFKSLLETNKKVFKNDSKVNHEWLLNKTEEFCQDKSLYIALMKAVEIADGKDANLSKTAIPDVLSTALQVGFNNQVGHDYLDDWHKRYLALQEGSGALFPCDIDIFNKITNGGFRPKTLNIFVGETGVGKSIAGCHLASSYLTDGYDVLYITLELSEEVVGQRIDANLMNINMSSFKDIPEALFEKKMKYVKDKVKGRLKIQEYPASQAHVGHFRALLRELKQKQNFEPQIIVVDYINIMASSRLKAGGGNYEYIKAICEELRGLATETNSCIFSFTQTNRGGYSSSDYDLTAIADSMGTAHTSDTILAMIKSEELEAENKIMIKQLKNRNGDINKPNKFVIGLDKSKMRFYNIMEDNYDVTTNVVVEPLKTESTKKQIKKFQGIKI